jgi:D-glycero-alpha-D-manno-heptose 1-phosphate guanylyltransferase
MNDIIILAGGLGTRLADISKGIPKPLMPVAERVFLDYVFDWLARFTPTRIVLSLCQKPELFLSYLSNRSFEFEVLPIVEPYPLGTGGAINYILDNQEISNNFSVLNGDTLVDFDFQDMANQYEKKGCKAMLGLTYMKTADRYGIVGLEKNLAISFNEKENNQEGWINNGCYILSKKIFESFSGKFSIEVDVFPTLAKKKELNVYKASGAFIDIGIPEDYNRLLIEKNGNRNSKS